MREKIELNNIFRLKGGGDFWHYSIVFVAGMAADTIPVMKKHGIRYFDIDNSMSRPEDPETHIITGKIRKIETRKWCNAMKELHDNPPTKNYLKTCDYLKDVLRDHDESN